MKAPLKLLCIVPYPIDAACVRYRVWQFLPHLRAAGIEAEVRSFMDPGFFRSFYHPGRRLRKALRLLGFALRRVSDVRRATAFDVVLVHREAALFGPPVIEYFIARLAGRPLVFDFDDAIHVPYVSPTYGRLATLLKYPQKTPQTLRMSRAVVAGNRYLEEYAGTLNDNVTLIPTVVDADVVKPGPHTEERSGRRATSGAGGPVVLGWIGTHSTYPYLESIFPVLQEVARRNQIVLRVVGAGRKVTVPSVTVDNRTWHRYTENEDLQSFDIGLYPILEDRWALGKSGFKAVQYMAVGIPAVCAPVGATRDIVRDGVDGFLPGTHAEWTERLLQLIEDAHLRKSLGEAGRERVLNWYCLERQAPRLQAVVEGAAS